jgi:putative salt-induced outer membrane protein
MDFAPTNVHRLRAALAAAALLAAPAALADWTGRGEAGLVMSRGNADSTAANGKLDVAQEQDGWKNSVLLAALYARNAEFATAQRFEGRYELDRKFSEQLFGFVALRGERDLYSGFDYQATLSAGLGYKFIDTDRTKLAGTLGLGYRRLRPEELIKDDAGRVVQRIKGEASGNAVGTAGLNYEFKATATTKFVDKLMVESGSSDTSVANDFGVQVSMSERLALSFGYGIRYNTDPAPGTKRMDQLTTINVVYTIK